MINADRNIVDQFKWNKKIRSAAATFFRLLDLRRGRELGVIGAH